MIRQISLSLLAAAMFSGQAAAADQIVGNWTTQSGQTAAIAPCGSGFCVTLKTGQHAGK